MRASQYKAKKESRRIEALKQIRNEKIVKVLGWLGVGIFFLVFYIAVAICFAPYFLHLLAPVQ